MKNRLLHFGRSKIPSNDGATPTSVRRLEGWPERVISSAAVLFSLFFLYSSLIGQPSAVLYKAIYILGTAALCILIYKGRRVRFHTKFHVAHEIFSFLTTAVTVMLYALLLYWLISGRTEAWEEFFQGPAIIIALLGFVAGAVLYWHEGAGKGAVPPGFTISDLLYLTSAVLPIGWWGMNAATLFTSLGGEPGALMVMLAGLLISVSFEIARRVLGPAIPIMGIFFLLYNLAPIAQLLPGIMQHEGSSVGRVAEFTFLAGDGMTGFIIDVFGTFLVIFILLGGFLEKTGVGTVFIDATFRLTGRRTGGPGITAVASSGLFGMISGSGVANVFMTGNFTIPLMKRVGYKPEFAAATEAAASTGGGYMPPIMGAGIFLLVEFTQTSYLEIIQVATIPAILYFLSVGYLVYTRAAKVGLHGLPRSELPQWSRVWPKLYLLIPIPVIVYYLLIGDSAFLAASKTIILILILEAVDILNGIKTPYSRKSLPVILGVSMLVGLAALLFGKQIGGAMLMFTPSYRAVNLADALHWVLLAFMVLKITEILFHASRTDGGIITELGQAAISWVKVIWRSLQIGAVNALIIGSIACVLGIILSGATQSALPGKVAELLTQLSFGYLAITLFWIIVLGYVVGMGLPTPAAYVILLIFGVEGLINLGVPVVTAHLICYWVAVISAVVPPVAISAYAASGIAKADPIKASFQAMKLASWILIMPFLFAYTPLLLNGTVFQIVVTVIACLLGIIAWAGALEGYVITITTRIERFLLALAAAFLLAPIDRLIVLLTPMENGFPHVVYVAGAVILSFVVITQFRQSVFLKQTL